MIPVYDKFECEQRNKSLEHLEQDPKNPKMGDTYDFSRINIRCKVVVGKIMEISAGRITNSKLRYFINGIPYECEPFEFQYVIESLT